MPTLDPAAPWVPAALAAGGLAAVLLGTLVFRLHALISLTLATLAVAWFTPPPLAVRAEAERRAERFAVRGVGEEAKGWSLGYDGEWAVGGNGNLYRRFHRVRPDGPANVLLAYRPGPAGPLGLPVAVLHRDGAPDWTARNETPPRVDGDRFVRTGWGDFFVAPFAPPALPAPPDDFGAVFPPRWDPAAAGASGLLEPGDLLLPPHDLAAALAAGDRSAEATAAAAFGETAGAIGLPVALAAVLGACLLASGAAARLVAGLLSVVGPRGHAAAFCAGGFGLGIPVFFDAVFLLCAPLAKKAAAATGGDAALLLMAVACGGVMTHSLVPPTPGPLLVAAELGVALPVMVAAGLFVSALAAPVGLAWCVWRSRRRAATRPDPADLPERVKEEDEPADPGDLPPLWAAALPLALPAFLIAQRAAWDAAVPRLVDVGPGFPMALFVREPWGFPAQIVDLLGGPTVALLCGALAALGLLWRRTVPAERAAVVGKAVAEGGAILLVAAAGGAFGAALRRTGVGGLVAGLPVGGGVGLLVTAWAVAAAVRTAQGSATVAMVTAAGVVGGAVQSGAVAPVWVACAIGCGSKAVAWMNASGFWVVCKAGGLTERQALATFTPLTGVLSAAGLAATLLGAWVWP